MFLEHLYSKRSNNRTFQSRLGCFGVPCASIKLRFCLLFRHAIAFYIATLYIIYIYYGWIDRWRLYSCLQANVPAVCFANFRGNYTVLTSEL